MNKNAQLIMIIAFSTFLITSLLSESSPLAGIIGIAIYSLYRISKKKNWSGTELIITIKTGNKSEKSTLRKDIANEGKEWKGSSVFLFLLLAFCLFLNSPIDINREIISQTRYGTSYKASIQNIDIVLLYGCKALSFLSFLIGFFLNINFKTFKILLLGIMSIAGIYVVTTFFHSNFQVSIFPALIIIIAGAITIYQNTFWLIKKRFNTFIKTI